MPAEGNTNEEDNTRTNSDPIGVSYVDVIGP